jgi:hypothetical protein
MSTLSIRIPDSVHELVKKVSKEDKISINQFIASAISEKITALETEDYLRKRGILGSKREFAKILKKVPNIKPNNEAL